LDTSIRRFVIAVFVLVLFGVIQVLSTSFVFALENFGDGLFFFKRQALFAVLGLCIFLVLASVSLEKTMKWTPWFWLGASTMLLLTLIPGIGVKVGGASRWIELPLGFRLEPSEFIKVISIFYVIYLWTLWPKLKVGMRTLALASFLMPLVVLLMQPDFGSFAVITVAALLLLIAGGLKWGYVILAGLTMIPAFYFLVVKVPYRMARLEGFFNPWADPSQTGFQVIQSMVSFSGGGLFGEGLGQSQSKLFFLPEAHTDFTLAVLGEELGFFGFSIIIFLYVWVVLFGFKVAARLEDARLKLLALGLTLIFSFAVLINSGVVLGLLPTKGLALPFLSYGGSALLANLILLGLLLRLSIEVLHLPLEDRPRNSSSFSKRFAVGSKFLRSKFIE
jgi:cell division protein FtsW